MGISTMSKRFMKDRLSAAGVSYVVTEKSTKRKVIRAFLLLAIMTVMLYMSANVAKEYLRYPKLLINEVDNNISLKFPAVTICSTSPISKENIENASSYPILKFAEFLKGAKPTNSTELNRYRGICDKNPMCHWSWFNSACYCESSPCASGICVSDKKGNTCSCPELLCNWPYLQKEGACFKTQTSGDMFSDAPCKCNASYKYLMKNEDPIFASEMRELRNGPSTENYLTDPELIKYVKLLENSNTNDISDIYEDLFPPLSELFQFGRANLNRIIVSCSFEKLPCSNSDFTVLHNAMLGDCYMFNYIGDKPESAQTTKKVYNYGGSSGLQLILNVGSIEDKVHLLSQTFGFRVVIHNPRHMPFVLEHGSFIRMGSMTAIGVSRSTIERLGSPWGECRSDDVDKTYVPLECRKKCRLENVKKSCSCYKKSFLLGTTKYMTFELPYCTSKNQDVNCIYRVINDIEEGRIDCDCPAACFEESYLTTLSNSKINNGFYRTVQGIKTLRETKMGNLRKLETQAQNFTGLKVFYQTLRVDQYKEISAYSWDTLVANIGGNLGFFMGLSVITFFEVIEFIWEIIVAICCKYRKRSGVVKIKKRRISPKHK